MKIFSGSDKTQSRPRQVELTADFEALPSSYKTGSKEVLESEAIGKRLADLKGHPSRILQESSRLLIEMNRAQLKVERRVELATRINNHVYPLLVKYFDHYQQHENSLPENNERRGILISCVEIAEQMSAVHKHLFREEFSESGATYLKRRQRLVTSAVRIFEWMRLEQWFRALRYQKLSAASWKDCNRLFFLMALHKDVNEPTELLGYAGYTKGSQRKGLPGATVLQLYLSIQLYGLLDVSTWPTRLIHVPQACFDVLEGPLRVQGDTGAELAPGWLVTYFNNPGPALFKRNEHYSSPSICIDYSVFYNQLVKDYETLAKMNFISQLDDRQLLAPLRSLPEEDRAAVLELMLVRLRGRERKQKRHAAFGNEPVQIYFGFVEAYKLLTDLAEGEDSMAMAGRQFVDTLARHSALLADDDNKYLASHWNVVNFSTGGMLLATEETQFTSPIRIGQLVAFYPSKEVRRPLIGYVARMNRPRDKQVELAVLRLSNYVEHAIIQDEHETGTGRGRPVLLSQNPDGKWSLVVQPKYQLVPGTPLKLSREEGERMPARLGEVIMTQQEFVMFAVSSPGLVAGKG